MALTPEEVAERRLDLELEQLQSYRRVEDARALTLKAQAVMYGAIAAAALALAVRLIV